MSKIEALMRNNKRELCDMILKYEVACDDIQNAVVELLKDNEIPLESLKDVYYNQDNEINTLLLKDNENLKLEAEADSKAYDELLKHKKSIMKKYRDELHKAKKNEMVEMDLGENVADIGGNVISINN